MNIFSQMRHYLCISTAVNPSFPTDPGDSGKYTTTSTDDIKCCVVDDLLVDWPHNLAQTGSKPTLLTDTVNKLLVDWPERKNVRVTFKLENNTTRVFEKTGHEYKSLLWYSEKDKKSSKKEALREAHFFRCLARRHERVDHSLWEDRVCPWGLENAISDRTAIDVAVVKKKNRDAVLSVQADCDVNNSDLIAAASRKHSRFSEERARKLGLFYETESTKT